MSESSGADQPEDGEMMNMFASVWVKVEVEEDDQDLEYPDQGGNLEYKKTKGRVQKKLKCDQCDYTTAYKNCLQIHILGHTNTKPLSCEYCSYSTRYPTSLTRHTLIQHEFKECETEGLNIFKCTQCSYSTYFKWNLNSHRRKHNLEKKLKCALCPYETAYRHNYIKHGKVHKKEEVVYKCDKCPFVTKYEGHISRHLAKIHNEVSEKANKCDLCDFSTKVKWRLNIHKQRSRQTTVMKCAYCEFETVYNCESKKHKFMHYNEIYACKDVESTQETDAKVSKQAVVDYKNDTTPEKGNHYVLDPSCELEWGSIQVLETSNSDNQFQCILCKYTSRFKASVQRHYQRLHTDTKCKPYKCKNCDFSTKTKDQISLHGKRSQSETLLQCTTCEFKTYFRCQLLVHQKCHYAHRCNLCDYACKHKYDIQKHVLLTHMGKGLKCRHCDFKSSRKEALISHESSHTGIKPFKCPQCEYMCMRKTLLDKHMKKSHGEVKYDTVVVSDNKIQSLKVNLDIQNEENESLMQILNEKNGNLD